MHYPDDWKYPYFSEFEFDILFPNTPYVEPGDELFDGIVVRDFEVLGHQPKIFRLDGDSIIQLIPVSIIKEDGTIEHDVWSATISYMTDEYEYEDEDES